MSDCGLGIIGFGAMGENLAKQALESDIDVVGVNTSERPELEEMEATVLDGGEYGRLSERLDPPRVVLFALHAGEIVDEELGNLLDHLEEGDVILEGGNSFWRDSIRRESHCREAGVHFLDIGVVNWLVQEAFKGETPIPVISQSIMELFKSRRDQQNAYGAVAAMRKGFGGHPYGEDEGIREQRITGRVENELRQDLAADDAMDTTGPIDRDN